jgi:hypothetical protein
MLRLLLVCTFAALACSCGSRGGGGDPSASGNPPGGTPIVPTPPVPLPGPPGWAEAALEGFETTTLPDAGFAADPVPDDGPFADAGEFFSRRGVTPPRAFRSTAAFGSGGWLTVESYTRREQAALGEHVHVVADPADPANRVLRVSSPEHTDGTVIRPTFPLPARYRISLRVGFASFGDGQPGLNGYDGRERAEPWWPDEDATLQNGFYWLTILDHLPRPHTTTWIHHHRKLVVDSDNHHPPWMEIWNGEQFVWSGEHPIMVIALDGSRPGDEKTGNHFIPWSNGAWQPSGTIRAVDAYLPDTWYRVLIERDGPRYTVEVSGRFRYGGEQTYRASIDAAERCVWHYPTTAAEAAGATGCEDPGSFASVGPAYPRWPAGGVWPDWFMFGDPHANYYEGAVHYDDVKLELWRE